MTVESIITLVEGAPRPIEVTGDGVLAAGLRAALDAGTVTDAPGTIIETTGTTAELERSLGRVQPLGTVVLAGPPPSGGVDLDVYSDLHSRGLTIIGVPDAS